MGAFRQKGTDIPSTIHFGMLCRKLFSNNHLWHVGFRNKCCPLILANIPISALTVETLYVNIPTLCLPVMAKRVDKLGQPIPVCLPASSAAAF